MGPVALTPARLRIAVGSSSQLRENTAIADIPKIWIRTPRAVVESDQPLRLAPRHVVNQQLIYQRVNHARRANAQPERERGHQRERFVRSQYAPTKPQVLKHFIPQSFQLYPKRTPECACTPPPHIKLGATIELVPVGQSS